MIHRKTPCNCLLLVIRKVTKMKVELSNLIELDVYNKYNDLLSSKQQKLKTLFFKMYTLRYFVCINTYV